jgi:hypothetical protein
MRPRSNRVVCALNAAAIFVLVIVVHIAPPTFAQTPWQWNWDNLGPTRMSAANGAINVPLPHPTNPDIVYVGAVNVRPQDKKSCFFFFGVLCLSRPRSE